MTVQNTTSQIDINNARADTPKYLKHVHIDIGPFENSFLGIAFIELITEMQVYTRKITPRWEKTQLLTFISQVNRGTLKST